MPITFLFGVRASTMETVAESMDGMDIDNEKAAIGKIAFGNFAGYNGAFNKRLSVMQTVEDSVKKTFTKDELKNLKNISVATSTSIKKGKRKLPFFKTQDIELPSGEVIKDVNRSHQISFYLHGINAHNLKALKKDGFVIDSDIKGIKYKLSEADIDWLTSVERLSPLEKKLADFIYETLNGYIKDELVESSTKTNGYPMKLRADYFSLLRIDFYRDFLGATPKSEKAKSDSLTKKDKTDSLLNQNTNKFFLEDAGALKSIKSGARGTVVLEDALLSFFNSINLAASYSAYALPLRTGKQLASDVKFSEALRSRGMLEQLDEFKRYLSDIETSRVVEPYDRFIKAAAGNIASNVLGANIFVALKQPVSYMLIPTEIDLKYVTTALPKLAVNRKETSKKIKEVSPMIRARLESAQVNPELSGSASSFEISRVFGQKLPILQYPTVPIHTTDAVTILTIVESAKSKVESETDLKGNEKWERIAEVAEKIIRRTQPMWAKEFRSGLGRSQSVALKLGIMFSSATSAIQNTMKRSRMKYLRGDDSLGKFLFNIFLSWISTAVLITLVEESRDWYKGYSTKPMDRAIRFLKSLMGPFYFSGNATSIAFDFINSLEKGKLDLRESDMAYNSVLHKLKNLYNSSFSKGWKYFTKKDYKAGDHRNLIEALVGIGDVAGIAAGGIPVKNLYDYGFKYPIKKYKSEDVESDIGSISKEEHGFKTRYTNTFKHEGKDYRFYKDAYDDFKELAKSYEDEMFNPDRYNGIPDENKIKYIKDVYSESKRRARADLISNLEQNAFIYKE